MMDSQSEFFSCRTNVAILIGESIAQGGWDLAQLLIEISGMN